MTTLAFEVNGKPVEVAVEPYESLVDVLRNKLKLTGTKRGCDYGGCGACTVLLDGRSIYSCMTLSKRADGCDVTTIEGLVRDGKVDPIQEAFVKFGALQCGFCIPGIIMSAKALFNKNPKPIEAEIREAITGNICRCTGYAKMIEAMLSLSK